MKIQQRFVMVLSSALMVVAANHSYGAEPTANAKPKHECVTGVQPEGGVTVIATFKSQAGAYVIYREAVAREVKIMAAKGVCMVGAYRVMFGSMEKYFDIWWAPDLETMKRAFFTPYAEYTPEQKAKETDFVAKNSGMIIDPQFEIVSVEKF